MTELVRQLQGGVAFKAIQREVIECISVAVMGVVNSWRCYYGCGCVTISNYIGCGLSGSG